MDLNHGPLSNSVQHFENHTPEHYVSQTALKSKQNKCDLVKEIPYVKITWTSKN